MSERKSWDVARSPRPAPIGALPARASAKPLREQRRKKRRAFWIVMAVLLACLLAGALYAIWLPALRIHSVQMQGPEGAKQQAWDALAGTYAYAIPRNSLFFLPQKDIRARILKAYPDVEAVSIRSAGLDAITVITTPRAAAFIWCGASVDAPPADGQCYTADASGFVFAPADPASAGASSTLRIFAPLDKQVSPDASPIRAHVVAANRIPDALRLVKALKSLGAPISSLAIGGDEGTFYLQGPAKIRYVLGQEEQAAQLAASVLPKLNLTDGTIDYIDLRFTPTPGQPAKVYVKKFGR